MPPLLEVAGENPAGASRGGGGGEPDEFRHNSHSSAKENISLPGPKNVIVIGHKIWPFCN